MHEFPIFVFPPSPLRDGLFYPFFCVLVFLTACSASVVCVSANVRALNPTAAPVTHGGPSPAVPTVDIVHASPVDAAPNSAEIVPEQRNASDWADFTDAGGRFRCRIPLGCSPQQKESGARSKVSFWIGAAEIGVIVRASSKPPIQADHVAEIAGEIRNATARQGVNTAIVSTRFTKLDAHPAADIVASVTARGRSVQMRGIKCVAAGHDHAITLTAPPASFAEGSRVLDKFLESYRVTVLNQQ